MPYTLYVTPFTLHPAPYTLHLTTYNLQPTPYTRGGTRAKREEISHTKPSCDFRGCTFLRCPVRILLQDARDAGRVSGVGFSRPALMRAAQPLPCTLHPAPLNPSHAILHSEPSTLHPSRRSHASSVGVHAWRSTLASRNEASSDGR